MKDERWRMKDMKQYKIKPPVLELVEWDGKMSVELSNFLEDSNTENLEEPIYEGRCFYTKKKIQAN